MEDFIFENNVDDMRARDLRNLLVQKLGVSQDLVNRMLDKHELKEMVTSIVYKRLQDRNHDEMMEKVYIATAVVGVLTILYMCRKYLYAAIRVVYSTFSELSYKSAHKLKLVVFNCQSGNFVPAIALMVSLLLEVLVTSIQFTILLGWFVPHGHVLRNYFVPTFSFPVSAGALLKAGSGGQKADRRAASLSNNTEGGGGIAEAASNFSLDIGPMITIAVLNFVINRLDEYAAGVVLQNVKNKDEKKAFKKFFGGKKKPRKEKESALDATASHPEDAHFNATSVNPEYVYGDDEYAHSHSHRESVNYAAGVDSQASADGPSDSHPPVNNHVHDNKLGNNEGFDLNSLSSAAPPAYVVNTD